MNYILPCHGEQKIKHGLNFCPSSALTLFTSRHDLLLSTVVSTAYICSTLRNCVAVEIHSFYHGDYSSVQCAVNGQNDTWLTFLLQYRAHLQNVTQLRDHVMSSKRVNIMYQSYVSSLQMYLLRESYLLHNRILKIHIKTGYTVSKMS